MAGIELEVSPAQEHLESLAMQLVETQQGLIALTGAIDYFRERCEKLERKLEGMHGGGEERSQGGPGEVLQNPGATETEEEEEIH